MSSPIYFMTKLGIENFAPCLYPWHLSMYVVMTKNSSWIRMLARTA